MGLDELNWMQRYGGEEVIELYQQGRMSRRDMMRQLVLICGSLTTASALLAACGDDGAAAPAATTPATTAASTSSTTTGWPGTI